MDLPAGEVPQADLSRLLDVLQQRLEEAQKKRGDQRSAAGGKQGHQKTPSFILALVQDAVEATKAGADVKEGSEAALHESEGRRQPRGGFTDVGKHTGGAARDTSWPIAASVARFVIEQLYEPTGSEASAPDWRFVMAEWEMWLVEAALAAEAPLFALARMLDSSAGRGAVVADAGMDVSALERRARSVRAALDASLAESLRRQAAAFALPPWRLRPTEALTARVTASRALPFGRRCRRRACAARWSRAASALSATWLGSSCLLPFR